MDLTSRKVIPNAFPRSRNSINYYLYREYKDQEADYAMTFSEKGPVRVVRDAERFVEVARDLLERGGPRHDERELGNKGCGNA